MKKDAVISDCGCYRYQLSRVWNEALPRCLFVMLNPSTADANEDDATIRRCIGFANSWGYGSLYVGNLFAYRSTDPRVLKIVENPYGKENVAHLWELTSACKITVFACGNLTSEKDATLLNAMINEFNNPHFLRITKKGFPQHPLYLKSSLTPTPYHED